MIHASARCQLQPRSVTRARNVSGAGQRVGGVGRGVEGDAGAQLTRLGQGGEEGERTLTPSFLHTGQKGGDVGIRRRGGAQHVDQTDDARATSRMWRT